MKIAIVVPEYREGKRVLDTIRKIFKYGDETVIVIDDGSDDGTFDLLKKKYSNNKKIVLRKHIVNLGKGSAMKTGVELAWKMGFEAVIFVDADGQHNPKHIKKFKRWLIKYPIVFGYRTMGKEMPYIRKSGNVLAGYLIKVLFGIKKRDLLSGYLGFRQEVYEMIEWTSQRYGIETEMATKVGKNKIPFKEIRIDTIYIDKYKGVTILDALKILIQIPFWYFAK